jgi:hypothetical protein
MNQSVTSFTFTSHVEYYAHREPFNHQKVTDTLTTDITTANVRSKSFSKYSLPVNCVYSFDLMLNIHAQLLTFDIVIVPKN